MGTELPPPTERGTTATHFRNLRNARPMSIVAKRLDGSRCHLVHMPRPRRHCVIWGPSYPPEKRGHSSPRHPIFRPMSIVAKRSPISATAELLYYYTGRQQSFITETYPRKIRSSATVVKDWLRVSLIAHSWSVLSAL